MSDRIRCACRRCTIRGLMGPAIVITVGVLFLLHETRGDFFNIGNTYPVIVIVIGLISLASALTSMEGHLSSGAPAPSNVSSGPTAPPPSSDSTPNSFQGQGQ